MVSPCEIQEMDHQGWFDISNANPRDAGWVAGFLPFSSWAWQVGGPANGRFAFIFHDPTVVLLDECLSFCQFHADLQGSYILVHEKYYRDSWISRFPCFIKWSFKDLQVWLSQWRFHHELHWPIQPSSTTPISLDPGPSSQSRFESV